MRRNEIVLTVAILSAALAVFQTDAAPEAPALENFSAPRAVAARVDGRPIYVDQVRRRIERVLGEREIKPDARPLLEAETLAQLIDRRLIVAFLARHELAASEQDLRAELSRIERQLAQQNLTLEQFLERSGQTRDDLLETLRWELSWRRYLEQRLTDENLRTYFERHRREFDGTRLRVAHLLLKPASENDAQALAAAIRKAEGIRAAVISGETTFADAVREHSAAPTAAQGGDIGLIGRDGPMPESFSQAAFALRENQVSEPTVTPFGVHLIQVLEVKPGDKTWSDARGELEQAVTRYLFTWAADQQRPHAQIEFTGLSPHFQPGTKRLAE